MMPTIYSKEFFKKKFVADTMKAAYMNACKWYATNVLSKDELHNVQIEFEKSNEQFPTVTIRLFATLDENELRKRHCEICRETSSLFYSRKDTNCIKCEVGAYQRRTDNMIKVKIEHYRELLKSRIKEDGE